MDRAEISRIEWVINRELRQRFARNAVRRAVLLRHGDDPAIEPGQLMVRVFIPAPDESGDRRLNEVCDDKHLRVGAVRGPHGTAPGHGPGPGREPRPGEPDDHESRLVQLPVR